jgi:hypothetical protein
MSITHGHATGRLDSSSLDKTAQANIEQSSKQNICRRVLLPYSTHTCMSGCIIYLRGIISNQFADFFSTFSSGTFSLIFFFLSCLVFRISCNITSFHPILHSYPSHLITARLGRTYIHGCIYPVGRYPFDPQSFLFSSLPVSTTSILSIYISTYHHNMHGFHKSCLSTFCFLVFVSPGGKLHNLHAMVNLSAGQSQAS